MTGKLIKIGGNYSLIVKDTNLIEESIIGTTGEPYNNLSLKNCQAIERGYDLDELANELECFTAPYCYDFKTKEKVGFKLGFQKALELLGDKKFSEEDILIAMTCMQGQEIFYEKTFEETQKSREDYIKNYIQSLQQTEWGVEIEMVGPIVYPANLPKEGEERPTYRPKLDSDNCLILKRK